MRAASSIRTAHLASGANIAAKSTSWKPSRRDRRAPRQPMNSSIGVESCRATWTPTAALVAPGRGSRKATPGRR
jgi:hypothetical protein